MVNHVKTFVRVYIVAVYELKHTSLVAGCADDTALH